MFCKLFLIFVLTINAVASFNWGDLLFSDTNVKEFKQGAGKQYKSGEFSSKGERGDKGYVAEHQVEKGAKGYHDKEGQKKEFAEEGGKKNGYAHRDGYYGQQNQGAKGSKGYHFEDKGSYAKGHSTHGHHNVHKLDEYKKNVDFYDKDHDEAYKENHGGYEVENAAKVKAQKAGGHFNKGYFGGNFGLAGKFDKGSYHFNDEGHQKAQGRDAHYEKDAEFANEGKTGEFKNFGYLLSHK